MRYVNENPIMSDDPYAYEGSHSPNEVICTVQWCIQDLLDKMASKGIPLTDENVDAILQNRFAKTLQDRSVEEGWDVIDDLIDMSL